MPRIWNGFNTTPHTLPDACAICYGTVGGDFVELACGHGKPEMSPIHAKCLISSFGYVDIGNPQPPRCPMCRAPVGQTTLAELVDYVREGTVASFPNAEDQEQKERIYKRFIEGLDLNHRLAIAQVWAEGLESIQPTEDEKRPAYWTDNVDRVHQNAQALFKDIKEEFLTLEELEQKQSELRELQKKIITLIGRADVLYNRFDVFDGDDPYFHVVDMAPLAGMIENTEYSLKDELIARQRYEDEGEKVVKTIWSGFDTAPPTKPSACAVCSGEKGGEFIILDCGHGGPTQSPLHVRCALDGIETSTENEATAHCPTCKETMSANTLARLAERVSDNVPVKYPNEDGRMQITQPVHSHDEALSFIEDLTRAENIRVGRDGEAPFSPWKEENSDNTYYDHMIDEAKELAKEINTNLAQKGHTLESLETDRFKLSRVKDRLQVTAGRAVMHELGTIRDDSERSFKDIHQLLKKQLRHIDAVDFNVRREQDTIRRQDEGETGRLQHIWNGFDTKPSTKPNACAVCLGEFGGEFMSLDCGHGAHNNSPLHVRCLLALTSEAAYEGADAHCPVCSAPFSEEALSRLMDCIQHDRMVRCPNDAGQPETTRLFDDSSDQQREKEKILSHLNELRESHTGKEGHIPADKDALDARYDHLTQKVEDMARETIRGIEEHAYTLEEFEEKEEKISELKQRVARLMERGSQPVFREKYQYLLQARERLEDAERQMRQEREEVQRCEKESSHMAQ